MGGGVPEHVEAVKEEKCGNGPQRDPSDDGTDADKLHAQLLGTALREIIIKIKINNMLQHIKMLKIFMHKRE